MKIPHFRGVFMQDRLPKKTCALKFECGIVNLNSDSGAGTHWTTYYKRGPEAVIWDLPWIIKISKLFPCQV